MVNTLFNFNCKFLGRKAREKRKRTKKENNNKPNSNKSIKIMTKKNSNSTITKMLLLNVRDLLRQQTCGDAHSKVMIFLNGPFSIRPILTNNFIDLIRHHSKERTINYDPFKK